MQEGEFIGYCMAVVLMIIALVKINRKRRGAGYYILAILWPFVGFIVACCCKDLSDEDSRID